MKSFDFNDEHEPTDPPNDHAALHLPDVRVHESQVHYADVPPSKTILEDGDLISGLLIGPADGTIQWLDQLCVPTRFTHSSATTFSRNVVRIHIFG
jgi:hypothetical protein